MKFTLSYAENVQILGRDTLARLFLTHYHVIARNNSWPIPTEILKIRINSFPQHTIEKDSKTLSKDICHLSGYVSRYAKALGEVHAMIKHLVNFTLCLSIG